MLTDINASAVKNRLITNNPKYGRIDSLLLLINRFTSTSIIWPMTYIFRIKSADYKFIYTYIEIQGTNFTSPLMPCTCSSKEIFSVCLFKS